MRELCVALAMFFSIFEAAAMAQPATKESRPEKEESWKSMRVKRSPIHSSDGLKPASRRAIFYSPLFHGAAPNVQVNDPQAFYPDGLIGRTEPTITASEDGDNVLAAWVDIQGACGLFADCTPPPLPGFTGFGFSTDGGRTWTDAGSPPVIDHALTLLDPWADRGGRNQETFYLSTNSMDDRTFDLRGVNVFRGHFHKKGFTWDDLHVLSPANADDQLDRDVIVMAKDGGGAGYVSESNFIGECGQFGFGWGQIELWRTSDFGDTWKGPTIISRDVTFITDPNNPDCGATGINQQGAQPVIGPKGEVYVVWRFGPRQDLDSEAATVNIDIARSVNGGVSFGSPVVITEKKSTFFLFPVGFNRGRIADHPRIAVVTSGPHKGRIYVVFAEGVALGAPAPFFPCPDPYAGSTCQEQTLTSTQVFLSFSDDRAQTWSVPSQIASPVPLTGVKRFWPVVSVGEKDVVNVVYYESQEKPVASNPVCAVFLPNGVIRYGTANSLVDTYLARSSDGGRTFTPSRISTVTSNWCTTASDFITNYGDYISSVSVPDRVLNIWTDGRNGTPDIFFSALKAKP
jgi:hypothetical protein